MKILREFRKIPNLVTLIRFMAIPFLIYFAYLKRPAELLILVIISGLTDFFDGFLARRLKQESEFGAVLDGLADEMLAFSSIPVLYFLRPEILMRYIYPIIIVFALNIIKWVILMKKVGFKTRMHLYSGKLLAVIAITCVLVLLISGMEEIVWLLFAAMTFNIVEEIVIMLTHKKISSDMKSFFDRVR